MDMKQSIEMAVFVIVVVALIASFFNLLTRERRREVGYTYSGGDVDWSSGSSNSSPDPGGSSGHSGDCSAGGSSGDGGSCGGGDGGGGGGGD